MLSQITLGTGTSRHLPGMTRRMWCIHRVFNCQMGYEGKTEVMRNWIRDRFGANRVRTNPTQEQRLAPERPPQPAPTFTHTARGGGMTYWNIVRNDTTTWTSVIPVHGGGTLTSHADVWYTWLDTPAKPVYPAKIALPEGI